MQPHLHAKFVKIKQMRRAADDARSADEEAAWQALQAESDAARAAGELGAPAGAWAAYDAARILSYAEHARRIEALSRIV